MTDERDEPMLTVASLANSFLQVFSQRIEAYNQGLKLIIEIDKLNQQNPEDPLIFILFEKLKDIFPEGEMIITRLLKQASNSKNKVSGNTTFSSNLDVLQDQQKENIASFGIKQEIQDNKETLPLQESQKSLMNDSDKYNSQGLSNKEPQKLMQILMQQQKKREENQQTQEQLVLQESQQQKQSITLQQTQITIQQEHQFQLLKQEKLQEEQQEKQKQNSQQPQQQHSQSQPLKEKENETKKKHEKIEQKQHQKLKPQQQPSKFASPVFLITPLNRSKKPKQLSSQQLRCQKAEGSQAYHQNFNPIKKIQDAKIIRSKEEDLKYQKHLERIIIFEEKYNIVIPEKFKNIILFFKRSQNERLPIKCALDESDQQFIISLCKFLGNNNEVAELLGLKKQLIRKIKNQGNRSSNENCTAKKETEYNKKIQKNYEQFMKFCQIKSTAKEESKHVEQQIPEKIKQEEEEHSRQSSCMELQRQQNTNKHEKCQGSSNYEK